MWVSFSTTYPLTLTFHHTLGLSIPILMYTEFAYSFYNPFYMPIPFQYHVLYICNHSLSLCYISSWHPHFSIYLLFLVHIMILGNLCLFSLSVIVNSHITLTHTSRLIYAIHKLWFTCHVIHLPIKTYGTKLHLAHFSSFLYLIIHFSPFLEEYFQDTRILKPFPICHHPIKAHTLIHLFSTATTLLLLILTFNCFLLYTFQNTH